MERKDELDIIVEKLNVRSILRNIKCFIDSCVSLIRQGEGCDSDSGSNGGDNGNDGGNKSKNSGSGSASGASGSGSDISESAGVEGIAKKLETIRNLRAEAFRRVLQLITIILSLPLPV